MNLLLNSRLPWFLICLLALTAAQAESQASLSWETFKSEAGNFSIEFPSPPKAKKTEQDSIVGHVINHIFESRSPSGDFSVDYSDLPGFAVAFTGNDTIYSHATGALLKKTLGKLQSNKDITCQGHSGKHLVYDIPQASGKPEFDGQAYLFLVDKRLYVINAIAPANTGIPAGSRYFCESLFWASQPKQAAKT